MLCSCFSAVNFADTTYPTYTFKKSDFGVKKIENALKFIKSWNKGIAVALEEDTLNIENLVTWEKNIIVINWNNKCKWEKCDYNIKNKIYINFLEKKITVWKRTGFTIKITDKNNKIDENFTWEIKINFEDDKWNVNFYGFENNNSPSYIFTKKDKWIHTFHNSIQYLNTWLKKLWANNPKTLDNSFKSIITIENVSLFMNWKKVSYDDLKLKIIPKKYLANIVRSLTIAEDKWKINKIGEKIHNMIIKLQKNPIKYKKTLDILNELSYIIGYYGFLLPG